MVLSHPISCCLCAAGCVVSRPEAIGLALARNNLLRHALPNLAGYTQEGRRQHSTAHAALVSQVSLGSRAWLVQTVL